MEYIQAEKPGYCILCQKPQEKVDEANYILCRKTYNFVMLNAYPYNPGHLMVAPYSHVGTLEELQDEELWEHIRLVREAVAALKATLKPQGVNIGINIGGAAGAGIEDHIHTHIVPRWVGDTNFMTVVPDVRVLPEALAETYRKLKAVWG
jgi:ATP adenylyltransferase